jgi:hypothetical protein
MTTGTFPKALWPGLHEWWGANYDEHSQECKDLFDTESSNQSYEEDVQEVGFGLTPAKPEGSSTTYDTMSQGFVTRSTHVVYSLGFVITREAMDDNLYEKQARNRTYSLAFSGRQTKENVAANIYNNGFTTFLTGDGVAMLSTAHTSVAGNWSNKLAVDADLSEASLEDLLIQIDTATDSRGHQIALQGQSLHIAAANRFEAERILKSPYQNDTANNAISALMSTGVLPGGYKVNHYFTDADAWFVRTKGTQVGMINYQRTPAEFTRDSEFDTDNMKAKSYERYSFNCVDPRAIYGSSGG